MTDAEWVKALRAFGLTDTGVKRALPIAKQLQPILDELTALIEREIENPNDRERAPWEASAFMICVVRAVALRDEVVLRQKAATQRQEKRSRAAQQPCPICGTVPACKQDCR